jgi:hypothetical protein
MVREGAGGRGGRCEIGVQGEGEIKSRGRSRKKKEREREVKSN